MAAPMRPMRVPHSRPTKIRIDTRASEGGGRPWLLVLLILIIFGGAIGTYVYLHGLKKEPPPEIEEPPPKPVEQPKVPEPPPEPEKPAEPEPPPPPPKKTAMELKAEADAAQKELDEKIAAARKETVGKELPGFAGAKFGERVKGVPIGREKLPGADGIAAGGYGYKMRGPKLKSAFRSFGDQPIVWVTPKTYQIYRIEFSRALNRAIGPFSKDLNRAPGTMPDPDTTNLVASLAKKLHRDPFALDPEKYPLGRREYVFPFGSTTLTVSEPGGDMQLLVVENEGMFDQVRKESEEERKEEEEKKRRMIEKQQIQAKAEQERKAIAEKVSEIADPIADEIFPENYFDQLLINISKALSIVQGVAYTLNRAEGKYQIISTYAYYTTDTSRKFEIGEGITGQVAKDQRILLLNNVPDNYIRIVSGLGQSSPRNLIVIPIVYDDETVAVLELASFETPTLNLKEFFKDFNGKVSSKIADILK